MWISYFSIDFDYFSKHYEEEIIENGIVCRDMIRLAMELNKTYNYLGKKMEVHKAITAHSRKQNESVKACLQLDACVKLLKRRISCVKWERIFG